MQRKPKKPIYIEEYTLINGILQFLLHTGTKPENPVLLFLHGGPGSVESLFAHAMQDKWEDIFTVVHWDQRGAGKTLTKNPKSLPTLELMLKDLFAVIQYLKEKYRQQKIALLGHSWGSVLGSTFVKKHPGQISFYVGTGQVISMLENERVGYAKLKERITGAGDGKALRTLKKIGDYPGEKLIMDDCFIKRMGQIRKLQGKYGLAIKIDGPMRKIVSTRPIFHTSDFWAMIKGPKANKYIMKDFLAQFDLNTESASYEIPMYYILGENDWQTPYTIAEDYFEKIQAPDKKKYILPDAGHFAMLDQPTLFFEALREISQRTLIT